MRYMMIVKADSASENGAMPTRDELDAMAKYNEELVKAGVLLAGDGLHASSHGFRVRYGQGGRTTIVDGPFAEAKELVGGFWIIQVSSRAEAVEWARRIPFQDGEVEVRKVVEEADFT